MLAQQVFFPTEPSFKSFMFFRGGSEQLSSKGEGHGERAALEHL